MSSTLVTASALAAQIDSGFVVARNHKVDVERAIKLPTRDISSSGKTGSNLRALSTHRLLVLAAPSVGYGLGFLYSIESTSPQLHTQSWLKSTTILPATCPFFSFCTLSLNFDRPTTVACRFNLPRRAKSSVSSMSCRLLTSVPCMVWFLKMSAVGSRSM